MREFEGTLGIYLDTNMIYQYVCHIIDHTRYPDEPLIIKLLSSEEYQKGASEIQRKFFISMFTEAEIITNIKRDFPARYGVDLTKERIRQLILYALSAINGKVIERDAILTHMLVDFAYLCGDKDDIIHVEIARNENLGVVTNDKTVGNVNELYDHVIGKTKFIRHVKEIIEKSSSA